MAMLYVVVLAFSMVAVIHCQKTISIENTTYVTIMESGKKLMTSKQMNITADKNKLNLELKSLVEVKNETEQGRTENFGSVTFTLTDPADQAASATAPTSERVTSTAASGSVLGGQIIMTVDVFTADGNLTRDTEITTVMTGDVRVGFLITNYNFPADVQFLDLSVDVSGSETATMEANDPTTDGVTYNLGGEGQVKISKKEMEGNAYVDVMPMMDGNMLKVRFNSTVETIEYAVVLKLADVDADNGESPSSSTRLTSLGLLCWFLMVAHRILW